MSCEDIPSLLDLQKAKKDVDDLGRLMGTGTGTSTNGNTGQVRPTYNKVVEQLGFKPGSGDFTTGFTVMLGERDIAWYNPVDMNWYSYLGVIPINGYQVLPGTDPTIGGLWQPVTNAIEYDILRSELSATSGTDLIGLPTGNLTEYLAQQRGIDPRLPPYNYKPTDSLSVRTASLQAAFNTANTTKFGIWLMGDFVVSNVLLEDHTSYYIWGSGSIQGAGTGNYVLGVKNCTDLKGGHGIYITGPEAVYGCGVKVWAEGSGVDSEGNPFLKTCSLLTLGFKISNVSPAWIFGDEAHPDNLLSEIVIENGVTYNVAEVARIIGSQAVIEFKGYQAVVTKSGGVPFTIKGGVLHFNGGELQIPGVTNGWMVQLLPLASNDPNFGNRYGSCFLNGTAIESASLWMIAWNTANVPNVVAGSGKFVMDNCSGFANFSDNDNLQADASFTGSVVITDTCRFFRTSPKPAQHYISGCAAAKVKIADAAFDSNFNVGLQSFRPTAQKPQYGMRKIFMASNLSGQSFPASGAATVMVFQSAVQSGENAFYSPSYSTATGIFTVPAGGLKSVKVLLEFNAFAARPNSEVYLLIDGVQIGGVCGIPNKFVSQMFDVGDLNAGQTIKFRLTNMDTGFSVGSVNSDRFVISARTE